MPPPPSYVSNLTLHKDLALKIVSDGARMHYIRYQDFKNHPNPLRDLSVRTLPGNASRRLERNRCRDLLNKSNRNFPHQTVKLY